MAEPIVFDISDAASDFLDTTGSVYLNAGTVVINNTSTKTSIDLFEGTGSRTATHFVMNGGDIRDWTYNAATGVLTQSTLAESEWNGTAWTNGNPASTAVKAVIRSAGCTLSGNLSDGASITLTDGGVWDITAHTNMFNTQGRASVEFRMDGGTLSIDESYFLGTDSNSSAIHFDISGGKITAAGDNAGLSLRKNASMNVYGDADINVGRIHVGVSGGHSQARFYGDSTTKVVNLDCAYNDASTVGYLTVEENATLRIQNVRAMDGHGNKGSLNFNVVGGNTFVTTMNLGVENATDVLMQTGGRLNVGTLNITGTGDAVTLSGGSLAVNTLNATGAFAFTGGTLNVGTYNGNLVNEGGTLDIVTLDTLTYETEAYAIFSDEIGTTTINGTYTQGENGILKIQFDGTESDQLLATSLTLGGTLLLEMLNEPTTPTSYKIFGDNPTIIGDFASVLGSGNLASWSFDSLTGTVNYLPSSYVPEPASGVLLLLGWWGWSFSRKKLRAVR
ncbi:MAG: PEP-CTERM sorting domain-containing protein [Planctomycetia bacterium]|nr:PEP-CTERM sorting domain-containing protein [Planctomycetia bacterium]